MNSHLTILINDKPVALPDDFSIDIEDQNPVYNDTEMFSYPFSIPLDGNRWLVKNIEDIHAAMKAVNMEHLPVRINADGLPFRSGTLIMQDGEEITNSLSMSIDASTQSFSELISDLQCRDIPVKDQIIIGEKIGNVRVDIWSNPVVKVNLHSDGKKGGKNTTATVTTDPLRASKVLEPQALGFSYPASCKEYTSTDTAHYIGDAYNKSKKSYSSGAITINVPQETANGNYINTSAAYDETDGAGRPATYCNARICYKHHALDDEGNTSSDLIKMDKCSWTNEDLYPYWVLDAKRPQSGICFYVLYFLDCLFAHLGVTFDKRALMEIEDLKHLCFFTTVCGYDTLKHPHHGDYYEAKEIQDAKDIVGAEDYVKGSNPEMEIVAAKSVGEIKTGFFKSQEHINSWLESRGCGGQIEVTKAEDKDVQELDLTLTENGVATTRHIQLGEVVAFPPGKGMKVTGITIESNIKKFEVQANVLYMVANSENFPDESVSTVISSLENAFGIKFSYDYEQKKVTAYLTRDVMRKSGRKTRDFHCEIHSMIPMTEKITGVRMRYSAEADAKEQKSYVRNAKGELKDSSYDTDYNFIDYPLPDGDTSKMGRTVTDMKYIEFFHNIHNPGDKNCYIDRNTGNAYCVKVNKEAKTSNELKPVLFEVGQFKGVEYGDCSEENEDFIHDISIDFTPVPFNDVNYFKEVKAAYGSHTGDVTDFEGKPLLKSVVQITEAQQPILCAYIDEDMEHEFVEQEINQVISSAFCNYYMKQKLKLVESYDPSGTDDGNSPLQDKSRWGFAVALMRGGGSDATLQPYDYNYDHFGTSKWRTNAGQYALACDSLDMMGNVFDYNGVQEGVGTGERFSLKIRAFKEPSWLKDPKYKDLVLCNADEVDETGKVVTKIRSRGLFDTFILPYAYFLLNRKKFMVRCTTTVAQVADIPNHWQDWWNIGGMKCLIDKVNTTIDAKTGMGEVELTVYAL